MALKAAKRRTESFGGTPTCVYWLAGRCNRNPCRFLHSVTPSPSTAHYNANTAYKYTRKPHSYAEKATKYDSKAVPVKKTGSAGDDTKLAKAKRTGRAGNETTIAKAKQTGGLGHERHEKTLAKGAQKPSESICKYWMNDNCVHGDQCQDLHSWFYGDGFSTLAKLHEHKKAITGIALPAGSDKLYSGSTDGAIRMWDCHSGRCVNVINLGAEITSLISEGPWIFVGVRNTVKAWNVQLGLDFTLEGPKGRVLCMVVGKDTLLAGAEDGVIYAWRGSSDPEAKCPFELVASLSGHTKAVECLTVGRNMLYSGSSDHSIKVWDLDTLQCTMTLNGHTDIVTSLICWDNYLLSCSFDCTIKVWACTEEGTLDVTYTHSEENGVLALCGMTNPEAKPILYCSCRDNSVRMYELPSFLEEGRLFARREVRSIEAGPDGLFFTGDGTGLLTVWKWLEEPKVPSCS